MLKEPVFFLGNCCFAFCGRGVLVLSFCSCLCAGFAKFFDPQKIRVCEFPGDAYLLVCDLVFLQKNGFGSKKGTKKNYWLEEK